MKKLLLFAAVTILLAACADMTPTQQRALSGTAIGAGGGAAGAGGGVFNPPAVAPEGAACFAALKSLRSAGRIGSGERVVIFNTGSGIKYLDCYQDQ